MRRQRDRRPDMLGRVKRVLAVLQAIQAAVDQLGACLDVTIVGGHQTAPLDEGPRPHTQQVLRIGKHGAALINRDAKDGAIG